MTTVSLQEAQAKLLDLIRCLNPGDKIVIIEHNQPVARLVPAMVQLRRKLGTITLCLKSRSYWEGIKIRCAPAGTTIVGAA